MEHVVALVVLGMVAWLGTWFIWNGRPIHQDILEDKRI